MMSEENVETVRRHTEAWNRCDLATWLALFSSDGEIDWSRSGGPLKGVYRGEGEWGRHVAGRVRRDSAALSHVELLPGVEVP
jgi:ketosteroid isomerase-like protein